MAADEVEATQVSVRLTTQLPAKLRVPPTALAVPARLTRYGLSEVVNSLLALGAPARARAQGPARTCAAAGAGTARASCPDAALALARTRALCNRPPRPQTSPWRSTF
jgi:hypothetical protein